jgi:DNA polymerase III subunit delta'
MPFSNLIGNDSAKAALMRMAESQQVPNTLLFYGPGGVGKSLFAIALAQLLMGDRHASKLASHTHPDLFLYYPEGKMAIHTVETIHQLISEIALPPYEAPCKVFIIQDAHQMQPYGSNALLKTLEEPPPYCYFILTTSSLDAMLPTIVSRSRKVPFFPIAQSQIESFVLQEWKKKPEEARRIAFLSHGSLAKAKQLTQHQQLPWRAPLIEILSLDLPGEYPQLQTLLLELEESCIVESSAEDEEESGASSLLAIGDAIFEEILAWHRDLCLVREEIAMEYLYHLDSIDRLKLALSKPSVPLERILENAFKSRLALERNVRLRTVLEQFFLSV